MIDENEKHFSYTVNNEKSEWIVSYLRQPNITHDINYFFKYIN